MKVGHDVIKRKPRLIWEYGKGWRTPEQIEQERKRQYTTKCPVCGEPSKLIHTSRTGGFKGARYTMKVYEHADKECVYQTAFYPDYFGKGPRTRVHKWSRKRGGEK